MDAAAYPKAMTVFWRPGDKPDTFELCEFTPPSHTTMLGAAYPARGLPGLWEWATYNQSGPVTVLTLVQALRFAARAVDADVVDYSQINDYLSKLMQQTSQTALPPGPAPEPELIPDNEQPSPPPDPEVDARLNTRALAAIDFHLSAIAKHRQALTNIFGNLAELVEASQEAVDNIKSAEEWYEEAYETLLVATEKQ